MEDHEVRGEVGGCRRHCLVLWLDVRKSRFVVID